MILLIFVILIVLNIKQDVLDGRRGGNQTRDLFPPRFWRPRAPNNVPPTRQKFEAVTIPAKVSPMRQKFSFNNSLGFLQNKFFQNAENSWIFSPKCGET